MTFELRQNRFEDHLRHLQRPRQQLGVAGLLAPEQMHRLPSACTHKKIQSGQDNVQCISIVFKYSIVI